MFGLTLANLPYLLLVVLPIGLMAVTVHEVSHGYVAYRFGDPTAHDMGRLTLNPLAHLDPIGTLMIFLIGFGWARPVPVNPAYFRNRGKGMMWVALAGPIANILMAVTAALLLRAVFYLPNEYWQPLIRFFRFGITINVVLAAFNMIPIPPLDGSRVVAFLLPPGLAAGYQEMERYGLIILLAVLFLLPWLTGVDIVRIVASAALKAFYAIMF